MSDHIDPREYDELEAALDALDEAYVRVEQAGRRILLLRRGAPNGAPIITPAMPIAREVLGGGYLGDPCPGCQALKLRRKGTCIACDSCGWDTGCG